MIGEEGYGYMSDDLNRGGQGLTDHPAKEIILFIYRLIQIRPLGDL